MPRFASSHVCTRLTIYRDRKLGRPQDLFYEDIGPIGSGFMLFTDGGIMQFTSDSGNMEFTDV